jgi:3-deoxy-D-arabino-heptulosonate 7-phosphate (DAHP) synthase
MPFRGSPFTLAPDLRPTPIGGDGPMVLIAGPCVLENLEHARRICGVVAALCDQLGIGYIFKSSFDKANRTSLSSFRGPRERRRTGHDGHSPARTGRAGCAGGRSHPDPSLPLPTD